MYMTYVKYYLVSVNQSIFLSNHKPNQTKRLGLIIFQTEPHCCTWKTAHINLLWFDFVRGLAVFLNTLNEEFDPYVIWVTSYFWRNWFCFSYRTLIWCFEKWFYEYCKIYLFSQLWHIWNRSIHGLVWLVWTPSDASNCTCKYSLALTNCTVWFNRSKLTKLDYHFVVQFNSILAVRPWHKWVWTLYWA